MSESNDEIPYSHHPYAYALSNPVLYTDPAGTCAVSDDGEDCHKPSRYPDPRNSVVCPEGWSWGGPSQPECLRNSDYAKVPPTDIGIMIGVSLSGAASGVVGGTVGVEQVFDLYDFETAYFFYGGSTNIAANNGLALLGLTSIFKKNGDPRLVCPASAGLTFYAGFVVGWRNYQANIGIGNYHGHVTSTTVTGGPPKLFPISGSFQYFTSQDGNMGGATVGIGVGSDILPIGGSRMDVQYSKPFFKQDYHRYAPGLEHMRWAPPTDGQASAFMAVIDMYVSQYQVFGPSLASYMKEIVRENAQRWKNY